MFNVTFQGRPNEVSEKVRSRFGNLMVANWKVWTVPQFINVNFVPGQYRVLFSNVVGLAWNAYLSKMNSTKKSVKVEKQK